MLAGSEGSFDVLGLADDRQGDDDCIDIFTEQQIVICPSSTGVFRVEIRTVPGDEAGSALSRCEGAGEDGLDGQLVTLSDGRLSYVRMEAWLSGKRGGVLTRWWSLTKIPLPMMAIPIGAIVTTPRWLVYGAAIDASCAGFGLGGLEGYVVPELTE